MKPYSLDFRQRVVELVDDGMARTTVAEVFGIGMATLKRWMVLQKTTGDLRPMTAPGQIARITPAQEAEIRALVAAHPDAILAEYADLWNASHTPSVSRWTIGRAIRTLSLSRKKRP
jgi:transposase